MTPKPLLTETVTDAAGAFEREWYCEPPPADTPFVVLDCSWVPAGRDGDLRQRIYAIGICAPQRAAQSAQLYEQR